MKKSTQKTQSESFGVSAYARVAAALGKTYAARRIEPDEVAADAINLAKIGRRAASAAARQLSTNKMASEARKIANRYSAEVIDECDPSGVVLGLRFLDGSYADVRGNVFRIA